MFLRITLLILLTYSLTSHAIVDMRNANFSDVWVDMEIPGTGFDLKVQRAYNSRSLFNGMFGFGWCSDFETSIDILPEGSIKLTECGAGLEMIYMPKGFSKQDVNKGVAEIVAKLKETKKGLNEDQLKKLEEQLKANRDLRDKYSEELGLGLKRTPTKKHRVLC